ncbi:hypothetical protein ACIRLA_46620 [Streptomyces sp. NPDC102364]|uniref:hypothetical protein n=1 Tax=Streptomyces sp. NPDC102364 TaxID=3366161 RepID=UPI00380E2DA5
MNDALNAAYRERAHLVALLASMTPGAVLAPAPDVDEPGWQIVYLTVGGRQCAWHIAPGDADLFTHTEHVTADDPRAQWDGHTTDEKYRHIANVTAYAGRVECGMSSDLGWWCRLMPGHSGGCVPRRDEEHPA